MRIIHSITVSSLLLTACSSAPDPIHDPSLESRLSSQAEHSKKLRARLAAFERVLLDLDRSMEEYFGARLSSGFARANALADKLENFIREKVGKNFDKLVTVADGVKSGRIDPAAAGITREMATKMNTATGNLIRNQQIAMAALGFSSQPAALDPLLNGAAHPDSRISGNAVLGLAMLEDPRTPPEVIARVMENRKYSDIVRTSAAWALHELQISLANSAATVQIWKRVLAGPIDEGKLDGVVMSALRGVGRAHDKSMSTEVVRYLSHPVALVRMSAAISLGRIQDPNTAEALMTLMEPSEQNANVRLAARKSLQALAGGNDRGYDIEAWRDLFQHGS